MSTQEQKINLRGLSFLGLAWTVGSILLGPGLVETHIVSSNEIIRLLGYLEFANFISAFPIFGVSVVGLVFGGQILKNNA